MPRIRLQPLIEMTKEQWKVFYERLFQREGKLTTKMAGTVMDRPFKPPGEEVYGELFKQRNLGAGEIEQTAERFPIAEARAKYAANPEMYKPGWIAPKAKVMTMPPGAEEAGLTPEELARKISYSRVKQAPIIPYTKSTGTIRKELESQEVEAAAKRIGINPEDVPTGANLKSIVTQQTGRSLKDLITVPPAAELASYGQLADALWKESVGQAGMRSMTAKVWEGYRQSSRQSSHIHDTRDYFISSFVRWKVDPVKFKKAYPREESLIRRHWEAFERSLGPQPTAIPGTIPPGGAAGGGVAVGGVE